MSGVTWYGVQSRSTRQLREAVDEVVLMFAEAMQNPKQLSSFEVASTMHGSPQTPRTPWSSSSIQIYRRQPVECRLNGPSWKWLDRLLGLGAGLMFAIAFKRINSDRTVGTYHIRYRVQLKSY